MDINLLYYRGEQTMNKEKLNKIFDENINNKRSVNSKIIDVLRDFEVKKELTDDPDWQDLVLKLWEILG